MEIVSKEQIIFKCNRPYNGAYFGTVKYIFERIDECLIG